MFGNLTSTAAEHKIDRKRSLESFGFFYVINRDAENQRQKKNAEGVVAQNVDIKGQK